MNSIEFPEQNRVYKAPPSEEDTEAEKKYQDLFTYHGKMQNGDPCTVSVWRMNSDEMQEFLRTGRIYLTVVGNKMPPVFISSLTPFPKKEESKIITFPNTIIQP